MIKNQKLILNNFIDVNNEESESFPFDLKFTSINNENKKIAQGPGIYFISYNDRVIYIGRFSTLYEGNIINVRWLKHLRTITLRGHNVGFGKNSFNKKWLDKRLKILKNTKLSSCIQRIYKEKGNIHFHDTGNVTSFNRLRFADENWVKLSKLKKKTILSSFVFNYIKFGGIKTKVKAKNITKAVEIELIQKYYPCCNSEYKQDKHADIQELNKPEKIWSTIEKICKRDSIIVTGKYVYE